MVSAIFIVIAAICNAVMDKVQSHYSKSIFKDLNSKWWNPKESWKNKWKNGDPAQGEAFLGSSTVFVLFTDSWHFFQFLFLSFLFLAVVSYVPMVNWVVDFIVYHIVLGMVFELFFAKIFAKE